MTTDIYPRIGVNLVIFTVVENDNLAKMAGLGVVAPDYAAEPRGNGLSLFVVTMQGEFGRMLPGDLIHPSETIESAARRVADQKLGLSLKTRLRQLGTFDDPNREPNSRVIAFPYWGMVDFESLKQVLGGRDRVGLELVSSQDFMDDWDADHSLAKYDGVSRFGNRLMPNASKKIGHVKAMSKDLSWGRLLGLDHDEMVFFAWRQLRHAFTGRLDPFRYLGLNPLDEQFRLSDLQEFQEVCRGERVQRDQFRRAMTSDDSFLVMRNAKDSSRPGKPANLFSLQAPPD